MFFIFTTLFLGTMIKYLSNIRLNTFIEYIDMAWIQSLNVLSWFYGEQDTQDNLDKENQDEDSKEMLERRNSCDEYSELTHDYLNNSENVYVKIPKVPKLRKGHYRIRFESCDEPGVDFVSVVDKDLYLDLVSKVKNTVFTNN